jgi:hypothetical protein
MDQVPVEQKNSIFGWRGQTDQRVCWFEKTYYDILVENSFEITLGDQGYVRIVVQIDKDIQEICGILNEMYFSYELRN